MGLTPKSIRTLAVFCFCPLLVGCVGIVNRIDDDAIAMRSSFQVSAVDNVRISFDLYRKPGRDAVVIICPGFFQSKETPTFQRLSQALAKECDAICMDFRGHGKSGGLFTFSAWESADLEAVLDWAEKRYRRIGILGFSLGAATTINLASHRKDITTLIAVSAPSAFEDIEFQFWTPEAIKTGIAGLEPGAGCRPEIGRAHV